MVFGNEHGDDGDERNFGRGEERDDGEQPVSVPAAVERLERGVRVSRDPLSVVEQTPETEEEEKGRSTAGVTVKTEVKEEPEVKREVVTGVSTRSENLHATDGYDSEYYDAQEAYESAYEVKYEEDDVGTSERSPSGFISRYTGPEWTEPENGLQGSYVTEACQALSSKQRAFCGCYGCSVDCTVSSSAEGESEDREWWLCND
ncbi:hypothetical protein PI126_g7230 [Phytophthora idaei]|nr:hypothetical protein PI126_g7230 [Phytophthora idaei]